MRVLIVRLRICFDIDLQAFGAWMGQARCAYLMSKVYIILCMNIGGLIELGLPDTLSYSI